AVGAGTGDDPVVAELAEVVGAGVGSRLDLPQPGRDLVGQRAGGGSAVHQLEDAAVDLAILDSRDEGVFPQSAREGRRWAAPRRVGPAVGVLVGAGGWVGRRGV